MKKLTFQIIVALCAVSLNLAVLSSCASSANELEQEIVVPETNAKPQIEPINSSWIYINKEIKWESPPKQIAQTFQGSLNSTIVVFYPSGEFASVGCTLYRNNKTKQMSISAGDDFSVLKGTWKRNDDGSITATSRLTHGVIRNYPEQVQQWTILKQSSDRIANVLELNEQKYVPFQFPNVWNLDQLAAMIADDNQRPN